MDSTLCKNNGQCIDESTNKKGFKCRCSIEYQGEYCEKRKTNFFVKIRNQILLNDLGIELIETTKNQIDTSTQNLLRFANRLT
jgi:hypothetical protein